jgi:hypothetical protein
VIQVGGVPAAEGWDAACLVHHVSVAAIPDDTGVSENAAENGAENGGRAEVTNLSAERPRQCGERGEPRYLSP